MRPSYVPQTGRQTGRSSPHSRPASPPRSRQPSRSQQVRPSARSQQVPSRSQQPKSPADAQVRSLGQKPESSLGSKAVGKTQLGQKQSGGRRGQASSPTPPNEGKRPPQEGRNPSQAGRNPSQAGGTPPQAGKRPPQAGRTPPKEGRKAAQKGKRAAFSWRWARRSTLIFVVSMLTVLFLIAVLQGIVTQTQVRIDGLGDRIEEEAEREEVLQQQKTEMISPARVVEVAKDRLGMVTPSTVVYLHPPDRR